MAVVSSIFLALALVLAVVLGPQTRAWTWGPAMLALGIAVAAALPVFWKRDRNTGNFCLVAFGTLVTAWFAWRACVSPVAELGQADLMLLTGAVGSFIAMRGIEGNPWAEKILMWGVALLLLANTVVIGVQVVDPTFTPLFRTRPAGFPSGFYGHYNEAANFLIASSMILASAAFFGRHHLVTRIVWGLIVIGGLAATYFTGSRGGIFGAALGTGVFMVGALMIGMRRKAKWFVPALIAIPAVGIALTAFLLMGWKNSQELRSTDQTVSGMMDNNSRLYFVGVAMSCIATHPIAGGGSRSFSWESYRFFDSKLQGDAITHKPEQVHNEIIQAATDYGITGAGLLGILLAALVVTAVVRILFSDSEREFDAGDAWRVGGLAALSGMFVQSCFSFVFHLLPGVILLGICLGKIIRSSAKAEKLVPETSAKVLISAAALATITILFPIGWKATKVTEILWSAYFSKVPLTTAEAKVDAMTAAIKLWPTAEFYQERATIFQTAAANGDTVETRDAAELAIEDYQEAEKLHPYDPGFSLNRADLLSRLGRDAEAENAYDKAIHLQGGMEPAFRAHFLLANHLMRKGVRLFSMEDPAPTLAVLEIAAEQMEESAGKMHWITRDMTDTRVAAHESLGAAREANGDYKGAMEAYNFAATLTDGTKAHYRAGLLYGKMAAASWNARRPAEALAYFIEAKRRILQALETPHGVTSMQRREYLEYLDSTIAFLQGAKIEPLPLPKE